MDSLVAKYSRPAYQQNEPFEDQDELVNPMADLSIKFAMPPVAQVRPSSRATEALPDLEDADPNSPALIMAPSCHR